MFVLTEIEVLETGSMLTCVSRYDSVDTFWIDDCARSGVAYVVRDAAFCRELDEVGEEVTVLVGEDAADPLARELTGTAER